MTAPRVMTASVLAGALLLFGMEPMVGRMLVPFFGSAVSTWLTALMFFQVVLFGGYLYAHVVAPRIGRWHLALLLLPLVNLPIGVHGEVSPEAPMSAILVALLLSIGLPFFVLSTTAVVLQVWWSRSSVGADREPYPLYAASNTGSLVALLGYPFIAEPLAGLRMQSLLWTTGYLVYAGLVATAFFLAKPDFTPPTVEDSSEPPPTLTHLALWAVLAGLPSGFLLAVTSVIANEVGSFPMVWVLPLAIYLGTFVLLFRDAPIGLRLRVYWPEIAALGLLGFAISGRSMVSVFVFQLVLFFVFCMAAHGELYARRPSPRWLTRYYLAMSFGGGVGGTVVNLVPPVWFESYAEYPLLVALFAALFLVLRGRSLVADLKSASVAVAAARLVVFQLALVLGLYGMFVFWKNPALDTDRNFYGIFRVVDEGETRALVHGSTRHGQQYTDPAKSKVPLLYYSEGGCMHDAFVPPTEPRRMAVVGLGAGVAGAYGKPGDVIDFYEIDPGNEAIARKWFSFMEESDAKIEVFVGDGRLKLAAKTEKYDLILLDAFSGDGIPTHLITQEAAQTFLGSLEEDGLLLFHISNRYYDLRPIVKTLMETNGLEVAFSTPGGTAICVAASRTDAKLTALTARGWQREPQGLPEGRLWTDDYVNVLWPLWWGRSDSYAKQVGAMEQQ